MFSERNREDLVIKAGNSPDILQFYAGGSTSRPMGRRINPFVLIIFLSTVMWPTDIALKMAAIYFRGSRLTTCV